MFLDRFLKEPDVVYVGGERPIRSFVKAASWRATGTADTILLSWFFTGSIGTALSIGFTEVATKMFLYYAHERVWNRISLGRTKLEKTEETTPDTATVTAPAVS